MTVARIQFPEPSREGSLEAKPSGFRMSLVDSRCLQFDKVRALKTVRSLISSSPLG